MAPTRTSPAKHNGEKPAAIGGSEASSLARKRAIAEALCRVGRPRGTAGVWRVSRRRRADRPAVALVDPTPDEIRADVVRCWQRKKREHARQCLRDFFREVAMARWEDDTTAGRVPAGPTDTEDGLAALMAQLTTAATVVPAPADQSGLIGEMFEKMAVSSDSSKE